MSYDLGRLRLNGLIKRVPDTITYVLTPTANNRLAFLNLSDLRSFGAVSGPVHLVGEPATIGDRGLGGG